MDYYVINNAMINLITPKDIEEIRLDLGMTIAQFCREVDISPATYHYWMNGTTHPMPIKQARILRLKNDIKHSIFTK